MELVVLVDDDNNEIGTAPKASVHGTDTPLHRAFSLFVFNSKNQVLLTKRASTKKTFPGVWTNSVCGHPAPGESDVDAAKRRLHDELDISVGVIAKVSPYRYKCADVHGILENEICPIYTTRYDGDPRPIPGEVDDWKWMDWKEFLNEIQKNPDGYSLWSREEAEIIAKMSPQLLSLE